MDEAQEKGLESLLVWKKAMQFAVTISREILVKIPVEEKYALSSQIKRASQSIPANIAEGYGRFYFQEGVRFAYIARGSLEETRSHLTFASEMHYIDEVQFGNMQQRIEELRKMINGYINYLKRTKRGINEPGALYSTSNLDLMDRDSTE